MANPQQQENMLLTEHFSWPPISLIDDIINTVNEVLYRCTDTFETGISGAPPHLLGFADRYAAEKRAPEKDSDGNDVFPDAALEIEEGVLKLETLMENAVDKNFDKLEIWTLRNVLCLPRGEEELATWVRLGHYAGLDTSTSKADGDAQRWTPEKLYTLRRKLVETQKLHAALLAEKTRNDALLTQLKALIQSPPPSHANPKRESTSPATHPLSSSTTLSPTTLSFLTHSPAAQSLGLTHPLTSSSSSSSSSSSTPLTTHTSFTTSQLPSLRHLLAHLRPHLASTRNSPDQHASDASRDRKLYLEAQSRRILERRGFDTREGVEGAVEGVRVRAEEVRGLEGIVEALGKGSARGARREGEGEGEEMDVS